MALPAIISAVAGAISQQQQNNSSVYDNNNTNQQLQQTPPAQQIKQYKDLYDSLSGKADKEAEEKDTSDERCKIIDKKSDLKAMDCYRNIGSYLFKYKPEVVEEQEGIQGVDDKPHIGIIAQEVEKNIPGIVDDDPVTGHKVVNTGHLTMANTSAIGEMVRKLDKIYEALGIKEDD